MKEILYFNSYASRDDYAIIKANAFMLHKSVKEYISDIITAYAKNLDWQKKLTEELENAVNKDRKNI